MLDPGDLGLPAATTEDLRGGDATHNAGVVRRLLEGEPGPVRDAVLLNAGAALAVHAADEGDLATRVAAGIDRARRPSTTGERRPCSSAGSRRRRPEPPA